jgi:hypothetical protein
MSLGGVGYIGRGFREQVCAVLSTGSAPPGPGGQAHALEIQAELRGGSGRPVCLSPTLGCESVPE